MAKRFWLGRAFIVVAIALCGLAPRYAGAANGPAPAAEAPPAASSKPDVPLINPPAWLASAPASSAPTGPAPFDPKTAQDTLTQIQSQIPTVASDKRLASLANQVAGIEASANKLISAQTPALTDIATKLQHYAFLRHPSASQQKAQSALLASRAAIDASIAPARSVATSAASVYSQIAERRRASFSTRVLTPTASPLSPDFWTPLRSALGGDFDRLSDLAGDAFGVAMDAGEPQAILGLLACLGAVAVLLVPVRRGLRWLGRRFVPAHEGVSRSFGAIWAVVVDTGLPIIAAILAHLALQWGGLLSPEADSLARAAIFAVGWSAAILALGRAIATEPEAGRRLMAISDDTARRLRPALWAVASVAGLGLVVTRLNYVIGASVPATVAANCAVSLAYAAVAGLILISFGRGRPQPQSTDEAAAAPAEPAASPTWTLISLTLSGAIVVTVGAVFAGYTTLATLIANQIFWLSMIGAITYILLRFVDDLSAFLFKPRGWASRSLIQLFNLRGTSIRQAGLLLTAGVQLLILVAALTLALTPFGQSGQLLLSHVSVLGRPIHIGSATISPSAIVTGIATFAIGLALAHMAKNWFERRYLPVTGWDSGLRNSVATGIGYLGFFIAFLCAFAASGLGLGQIALIASALSVGIGFGLQQVVQNFASGLILLVERPVKVGDWVSVDGVEGDIRRIRVRATEIAVGDKSTVIVPNSDLITKQVQNKTLGNPRGQVVIKLPVGNAADALRAPALIAEAAKAHKDVIQSAPPVVQIDGVDAGGVVKLQCALTVSNPRDSYRIRSELYFAILNAFQENGISMAPYAPVAPPTPTKDEDAGPKP